MSLAWICVIGVAVVALSAYFINRSIIKGAGATILAIQQLHGAVAMIDAETKTERQEALETLSGHLEKVGSEIRNLDAQQKISEATSEIGLAIGGLQTSLDAMAGTAEETERGVSDIAQRVASRVGLDAEFEMATGIQE